MIFFRTQNLLIKHQRGDRRYHLFGKLKVTYSAPVDSLSGMTVNLQDVDRWIWQAQENSLFFENLNDTLRYYHLKLTQASKAFKKVEILLDHVTAEFDGLQFYRTYLLSSWFLSDSIWVQRRMQIRLTKPLSLAWRIRLLRKKWSSSDHFAFVLKKKLPEIQFIEIKNQELNASEKFI